MSPLVRLNILLALKPDLSRILIATAFNEEFSYKGPSQVSYRPNKKGASVQSKVSQF